MKWESRVKITHLMTRNEDWESVKISMKEIADALKKEQCFSGFDFKRFYKIPKGDEIIKPSDYANKLIDMLYNYADENRIWIE